MDPFSKGLVGAYLSGLLLVNWLGGAYAQDAVTTVVTSPGGVPVDADPVVGLVRMVQNIGWPGAVVVVVVLILRRERLPVFPIRISHYHYQEDDDEPTNHGGVSARRRRRELVDGDEDEDTEG